MTDQQRLRRSDCPALVLNADYQPLVACPPSRWSWQEALEAVLAGRVRPLAYYDRVARSPSTSLQLPAIVALKHYVSQERPAPLTRFNLFLRDGFRCVYCGRRQAVEELTFDHLVPRARGGTSCWENLVAACRACNGRKGDRTLAEVGFTLPRRPERPTQAALNRVGRRYPPDYLHQSWADLAYWDAELEA